MGRAPTGCGDEGLMQGYHYWSTSDLLLGSHHSFGADLALEVLYLILRKASQW
jgi:hypothetical protein